MALGVFAFSCIFLFTMSGVYHLLGQGDRRAVLQRLDHAAIFVLIAGTFTPAHSILFRGVGRWVPLLLIWSAAATGITLKTIFFTDVPEWLGLTLYLTLGWLGAASGVAIWLRHGTQFLGPLTWGAIAYTAGGALEFFRWPVLIPGVVGPHELFHLAVLVGAGLHWRFTWLFANGAPPVRLMPIEPPATLAETVIAMNSPPEPAAQARERQPLLALRARVRTEEPS
jgi:channel protein (hemolysin III family)